MNQGLIPNRYAKALLKHAEESHSDERLYDMMRSLAQAFDRTPALQQAMANPFVSNGDKRKLLATAAGATEADIAFNDFTLLLAHNHRLPMAREIALAYISLFRKARNISQVTITSAAPLPKDEEQRLIDLISSHLHGGTMELTTLTDPNLIGGFTVKINNEKLDASIANELKQLRLKLLSK